MRVGRYVVALFIVFISANVYAWTITNQMDKALSPTGTSDAGNGWSCYQYGMAGGIVSGFSGVSDSTNPDPSKVMQFLWPGACKNDWSSAPTGGCETNGMACWVYPGNIGEIWMQYYFKYSSNWTWHGVVNKHWYIENGGPRIYFGVGGDRDFRFATSTAYPANYTSNVGTKPYIQANTWYKVDVHIIMSTPGVANGSWQVYLNDVKTQDYSGINILRAGDPPANQVFIAPVWGGNSGSVKSGSDEYAWFDKFTISSDGPISTSLSIEAKVPNSPNTLFIK